jgi:tellurite methyltransferase
MTEYKYQTEYELSPCFWGTTPAKYVRLLVDNIGTNLAGMRILDLDAGEGKNSVYLARFGGDITAVDVSSVAFSRFNMQPSYDEVGDRIKMIIADIKDIQFDDNVFDVVVAYGILHCLDSVTEIADQIYRLKKWIKKSGYFVGCTFTNELPFPECQPYLNEKSFLKKGELKTMFDQWDVIAYEDAILEETHPTTGVPHRHSLSRIIARKP